MVTRPLLRPLVPAYAAALAAKEALRLRGALPIRRLPEPVISVGSVSAGGAGKTPLVLALTKALSKREYAVRILTRGYGRKGTAIERVDPDGDPARFGDEPLLLAQRSGVPVFVGGSRYRAGLLARELPATQRAVFLLDDGFQHRQLARDMDLVLLTSADLHDHLLPAGNLREPLSQLRKADVIVVRADETEAVETFLRARMPWDASLDGVRARPALWIIRRRLVLPQRARLPERPLIFSAIARSQDFTAMLSAKEIQPVEVAAFPDHHAYTKRDIAGLCEQARHLGVDGFVTTEKDAVKLTTEARGRLEAVAPLVVPRLEVDLVDERAALEQIITKVSQMNRRRRIALP